MRVVHIKKEPWTHQVSRPARLGNPFSHRPSKFYVIDVPTRADAIKQWEAYCRGEAEAVALVEAARKQGHFEWLATPSEMIELIRALPEDAVLACWCAPEPCHANVIMKIWKELHGQA